ncbi:MAG: hypothetical protein ABIK28_20635 [Planctomycetota bacterium]
MNADPERHATRHEEKRETLSGMFRAYLTLYLLFALIALLTGSCS